LDRVRELGLSLKPDVGISEVDFLPVIPRPEKFLAIGINFREHAEQIGRTVAARPGLFSRFPDSLVGHKQPMIRPRISPQLDFEGELAVIIGKAGRYIHEASAMEHVAGYACFVDGSVRDYQKLSTTAGKNFPATGPFGPWMVTRDEIPDPRKMVLTTRVNGQIMQQAGVELMIHTIATLISYVSESMQLNPGDVLSTGTPGGVGHKRNPPVWLKPGDVLEFDISGIGTLTNMIVDEKA
jgi:2-keto-4-pentenoate hydratase/2-oxohepta-3-ene-1,7-dioic acid hydratase in catechol pathway